MKELWSPSKIFTKESNMYSFMQWVNQKHHQNINDYQQLWSWSIDKQSLFWGSIVEFYDILLSGQTSPVVSNTPGMIGTTWFPNTKVNYAEHIFRNSNTNNPAIVFRNEKGINKEITWKELETQTANLVQYFKKIGLGKGSKVATFLPNIPEAIAAFLACNAIGAIWSSCSPDFGTASVIDRFSQIQPDVLIVANGYWYNNKPFNKTEANNNLINELTSIKGVVNINYCTDCSNFSHKKSINWEDIAPTNEPLTFEQIPFNDPIWVLYSSGTTGKPKAITHSVGGILIEHYKALGLHQNVKPGEVFFWYSTTGWMMWNYANAALLVGGTVAIYDGSPAVPNLNSLWDFASYAKVNQFGAGASFFINCMKKELQLNKPLEHLISLGSTGSPLTPEAFDWIYKNIKEDLWLISLSGGTDICSGFVGGNPFEPVIEGEIQCRMLGVDLKAKDESGNNVIDELGEMVISSTLPSMPIYFWNDTNNTKYRSSYFEMYSNEWRHGDWIKITSRGSVIIYGRSDSTLNRGGVRIGTSEVYNAVESIPEIKDSVVVCIDQDNGNQLMPLFIVLNEGESLTNELIQKLKTTLKTMYSPRHIPDSVHVIAEVPYTISGKKMETPIKKLLSGKALNISKDAMKNPSSLDFFETFKLNG